MKARSFLVNYIHTQNSGWIFALRIFHGKLHSWLLGRRIYILGRFKKKQNLVVATSFNGKRYADNPRYILEAIHELSPETELIWIKNVKSEYSLPDYVRSIEYKPTKAFLNEIASASILIDNDMDLKNYRKVKKQLIIQTWHGGLGIKKIGYDVPNGRESIKLCKGYDFFISNSDHITNIYRSAFAYFGPVWKCGYPIEDALLIENGEREKIRKYYGLSGDVKIALYAPTFRKNAKWNCVLQTASILRALEEKFGGNWIFAVRWHPIHGNFGCAIEGAIDMTSYVDMQELVKASDVFISDYSSGIFQAVQCGIPSFIYANDYSDYKEECDFYYSLDELPFPHAFSQDLLLRNIMEYDDKYWEDRWYKFRSKMGHKVTGHSTQDIAKVCVDFLNGKSKADIMSEIPFETRY